MSEWGITPRESVQAESARRGHDHVVEGCIELLEGGVADDDLYIALAGPAGRAVLGGAADGVEGYWPRVWGARGLLHVWDDVATQALVHAAGDDSWRVREMAMKVVARHLAGEALEVAARLAEDPAPRVRKAAERALSRLVHARA